ncbi:hypothetical protein MAPG_11302 [Magnaporthiopsis poae ATCC 64411]|uniref:DUF7907 domain-containing protein n=1 Tax=Magnaporthiopsis poae (strain ATCC 64411 / 73-15) TaxID=644358 RepID=A0A0C4EEX0_MAGP6|nr:hypothetical protein MAPG_11302 [Magnaporthiopsis poae ATCC 64411]
MQTTLLTLGLAALATAAPAVTPRQTVPHYPPSSVSKGFRLISNVTDPTRDLTPSVHGFALGGIHIGPPNSRSVLSPQADNTSRLFYLNGTASDLTLGTTRIVSDGGTPPFPWGVHVQGPDEFDLPANPGSHATFINGGSTLDVGITKFPDPYSVLVNRKAEGGSAGGTFVACYHEVPYYRRPFVVVDYAYATVDPDTALPVVKVPEGCAPITLIPQCAVLNDLPPDAISSHEFALDQKCYEDVASIDWKQYGP